MGNVPGYCKPGFYFNSRTSSRSLQFFTRTPDPKSSVWKHLICITFSIMAESEHQNLKGQSNRNHASKAWLMTTTVPTTGFKNPREWGKSQNNVVEHEEAGEGTVQRHESTLRRKYLCVENTGSLPPHHAKDEMWIYWSSVRLQWSCKWPAAFLTGLLNDAKLRSGSASSQHWVGSQLLWLQ